MRSLSVNHVGPSYLASFLAGEAGLCNKLAMFDFRKGHYTTYVSSKETSIDVNNIYSAGILSPEESDELFLSFPGYLRSVRSKIRNGTLIVQSPWSQPTDAAPRSLDDNHLLQAGFGVCHTCSVEKLDENEFSFMIGDTIAMRYVACIIESGMTVADACVASEIHFCNAVVAVLVPAYDGESILMWERDE